MMTCLVKIDDIKLTRKQRKDVDRWNNIVSILKRLFNNIAQIEKDTTSWQYVNMESSKEVKWMRYSVLSSFLYACIIMSTVRLFRTINISDIIKDKITPNDVVGYSYSTREIVAIKGKKSNHKYQRLGNLYYDKQKVTNYDSILKYIVYHKSFTAWYLFYGSLKNWKYYNKQQYVMEHVETLLEAYISTLYTLPNNQRVLFDPLSGEVFVEPLDMTTMMEGFFTYLPDIIMTDMSAKQEQNEFKIIKFEKGDDDE